MRRVRVNARVWWRWHTKCQALGVGEQDERGHYPALFCDHWRGHSGDHYDRDRDLTWSSQRSLD